MFFAARQACCGLGRGDASGCLWRPGLCPGPRWKGRIPSQALPDEAGAREPAGSSHTRPSRSGGRGGVTPFGPRGIFSYIIAALLEHLLDGRVGRVLLIEGDDVGFEVRA